MRHLAESGEGIVSRFNIKAPVHCKVDILHKGSAMDIPHECTLSCLLLSIQCYVCHLSLNNFIPPFSVRTKLNLTRIFYLEFVNFSLPGFVTANDVEKCDSTRWAILRIAGCMILQNGYQCFLQRKSATDLKGRCRNAIVPTIGFQHNSRPELTCIVNNIKTVKCPLLASAWYYFTKWKS